MPTTPIRKINIQQAGSSTPVEIPLGGYAENILYDESVGAKNIKQALDDKASATPFTGASSSAAGTAGIVPAPAAGDEAKYLKGDGTWATVQSGTTLENTIDSPTSGNVGGNIQGATKNQSYTLDGQTLNIVQNIASGDFAHAEGFGTSDMPLTANGIGSHAEGYKTTASGAHSHAEGGNTIAVENNSHAEGYATTANGEDSHAEGAGTKASGMESHAEGQETIASGDYGSHAEGYMTTATGDYGSHTEGNRTKASGEASHAEGFNTTAGYDYQHVSGKYNNNKSTTLFEIGNGTSSVKKNIFEVYSDGTFSQDDGTTKFQFTENNSHVKGYKDASGTFHTFAEGAISTAEKGAASGVAELDANGKVPSSQLPSYVDDVVEAADFASLPATGETGKIYITLDDNKTYRWSGSAYVEISSSLALGETDSTAYRGDRGKAAYDHSQDSGKISSAVLEGLYKIAATAEGHVASLTAVAKSDITALGIPASDTQYEATTTSIGSASGWNAGSVTDVSVSGDALNITVGTAPTLTVTSTTVATGIQVQS